MNESAESGSESGLYRIFTSKFFSVIVLVLWAILAALSGVVWNDVQNAKLDIATLKQQRISDVEARETLSKDIQEMKADIKELLREARR